MRSITKLGAIALFTAIALAMSSSALATETVWKGWATGSSEMYGEELAGPEIPFFTVYDNFSGWGGGQLGYFTAEGDHSMTYDLELVGQSTWTCADGATLFVTYEGNLVITEDEEYPYRFTGVMTAKGGTGRLVNAYGTAPMTGGFSDIVGDFYFDFDGMLDSHGNLHEFGIVALESLRCGKAQPVPYTMEGWSPITGLTTSTGTIMPISEPVMDSVDGKTIWSFTAEQGPNKYYKDLPPLHVIVADDGLIYAEFVAQCRIEIDHELGGLARMYFDGCFTVVGGTDRYEDASGVWQTSFVTEPGDMCWGGYLATGTLLPDQLTADATADLFYHTQKDK